MDISDSSNTSSNAKTVIVSGSNKDVNNNNNASANDVDGKKSMLNAGGDASKGTADQEDVTAASTSAVVERPAPKVIRLVPLQLCAARIESLIKVRLREIKKNHPNSSFRVRDPLT